MLRTNAISNERQPGPASRSVLTLLDLVTALSDTGATDREVVAAVLDLLESGRVRLLDQAHDEHRLAH
jgi:hypothetical protein